MATGFRALPHIQYLQQLGFASDEINRAGRKQRRLRRDPESRAIDFIVDCLSNV